MSIVPSGRFSLQGGDDRLTLTFEGTFFGQHRLVFDRVQGVFLRDGQLVCGLHAVTGVEVQSVWQGQNQPPSFMLVVARGDAADHLYTSPDKQAVTELAERIAAFLNVEVTHREQPFQRAVREKFGIGTPTRDGIPSPPLRIARTVRGVTSIWGIVAQLFVGLGLLGMAGWMVYLGTLQTMTLVVGGVFVLAGFALVIRAALQLRRHFRDGGFRLDPGDPFDVADEDPDARFAPALGAARGQVGLLTLVNRTSLLLGVVLFLAGSGALVLLGTGLSTDNSPMMYLVGLIFFGIGAFIVWEAIKQIRAWRSVQASPIFGEAVVQEIRSIGTRLPRHILKYSYQDPNGGQHVGESHPLKPAEARWWRTLDVAEIQIDQHQPGRSMLIGARPIRRSTREEPYPDGEIREPGHWRSGESSPE